MKDSQKEIIGIFIALLAVFLAASFITYNPTETPGGISSGFAKTNIMGLSGIYVSYYIMKFSFGWSILVVPISMLIISYTFFTRKDTKIYLSDIYYILSLGIWSSSLIAFWGINTDSWWQADYSGYLGYSLTVFLIDFLGIYAYLVLLVVLLVVMVCSYFNVSLYDQSLKLIEFFKLKLNSYLERKRIVEIVENSDKDNIDFMNDLEEEQIEDKDIINDSMVNIIESNEFSEAVKFNDYKTTDIDQQSQSSDLDSTDITIDDTATIKEEDLDSQADRKARYREYKLPSTDYLVNPDLSFEFSDKPDKEMLHKKAESLVHALDTFGVSGKVVKISPGPIITLFEIEPGEGVRVNKFTNLADDLARVMKAQRIRVIAPIPGSKSVGIELPNDKPSIVYLKNIINSEEYVKSKSKLTIGLGKTTIGEAYTFELNKMPHLLVAGATGAGKSVCINTIIVSILYKAKPDEVKFILIDPKKLELATYQSLVGYHLITAPNLDEYVMTTAENAVGILDSAITEMERRFQIFADARVRNISEYHERQETNSDLENVPYIVVLIDELADLMMTSGRAVEEPITRLAQKARAVGIHLVVATQRPSVDVITGLIKSNFPARISFQVSSKIDSRTIIDQMGAEQLLGRGDMLFLLPGSASPIRLHNALIELDEIEKIMNHIESQPKPDEVMLPETKEKKVDTEFSVDGDSDELLRDAARMVVESQQASVSMLQRKFRIGYSRAGRIIDELESLGIVSGYSGSKARDVLVELSYLETVFGDE